MSPMIARTSFVQERIENRPAGPGLVHRGPPENRAISRGGRPSRRRVDNGIPQSREPLPRETEAIARELGTSPLPHLASDRLDEIVDDCLRLAEERLLSEKHLAGEFSGFA